jgi:hypothetical protein
VSRHRRQWPQSLSYVPLQASYLSEFEQAYDLLPFLTPF